MGRTPEDRKPLIVLGSSEDASGDIPSDAGAVTLPPSGQSSVAGPQHSSSGRGVRASESPGGWLRTSLATPRPEPTATDLLAALGWIEAGPGVWVNPVELARKQRRDAYLELEWNWDEVWV